MLDKDKKTTQTLYTDDVNDINEKIVGSNIADRVHTIWQNWVDTHDITYGALLLQDMGFIERLSKKLDKYNGTK